ncbi:hypothetical protein D9613_010002 [Agrocybe pediades]|uniref:Major facilitator superfamily (MFS) profile domain-containing protein n=1 Tax=Agrocybe pediades TaxID=84607 RepID=A0A8H4VSX2_9AGAR|nr:hypothetical protein D9613_010002 [Agrocybe pediades]
MTVSVNVEDQRERAGDDCREAEEPELPERRTPLPLIPIIAVLLLQLAEPITGTVIYPFINQLVRETGVTGGDEKRTGYYAGIIESAFFAAESLTVVQWGYLSDRYGRRPILLCAPLGLTIAMLGFGSSTTFWPLVGFRCLQGIFNGNIGVAKSVMAELTDSTNRPDAFALIPFAWSVGSTTGPFIGGILSNAATKWPDTLGRIAYLKSHPYFLPCLVAGLLTFLTFIFDFFGLKETLPSIVAKEKAKRQRDALCEDTFSSEESQLLGNDHGNQYNYGTNLSPPSPSNAPESQTATENAKLSVIFTRPILMTLVNHIFLTFTDMCHYALLPLMYSTPIEYGGLGLSPFHIGVILGTSGFVNAILQVNFLGPIIRRFGPRKVYRVSSSFLFVMIGMYPILRLLVQRAGGVVDGFVIAGIVVQVGLEMTVYMAYGALQIVLVECIPEGGPMGTVNGIAQMLGSGMRSLAPTFATSLFSASLEHNLAGGNMVYYILLAVAFTGSQFTALLPKRPEAKKRSPQRP